MQQAQRAFQDVHKHLARRVLRADVVAVQAYLAHLDVPVAELAPQKLLDLAPRLAELVGRHQAAHIGDQAIVAADDPPVHQRLI